MNDENKTRSNEREEVAVSDDVAIRWQQRGSMYMNVIMTFNTYNDDGNSQEIFDLYLPLKEDEGSAVSLLMREFFGRIADKCVELGRRKEELIKISTASDWGVFEYVTHKQSLTSLGHSCKWYFGTGRDDLDEWEEYLMSHLGFGTDADMSERFSTAMNEAVR
jgi:hypothetical protein